LFLDSVELFGMKFYLSSDFTAKKILSLAEMSHLCGWKGIRISSVKVFENEENRSFAGAEYAANPVIIWIVWQSEIRLKCFLLNI
jgi:hypothetical protein